MGRQHWPLEDVLGVSLGEALGGSLEVSHEDGVVVLGLLARLSRGLGLRGLDLGKLSQGLSVLLDENAPLVRPAVRCVDFPR